MINSKLLLVVALLATPLLGFAQDESETQASQSGSGPWTLKQCIDYALENNIEVKNNALAIETAEENVTLGKGQLYPSLSFSMGQNLGWRPWSQSTVNLSDGTLTTTQSTTTYSGSYSLSANWTVWNGGKNRRQLDQYKLTAQQAELTAEATEITIQEQILQYYVQILYEADAVNVADSSLESSKLICDRARQLVEVGQMSKVDLAQLEAQTTQDEYSVVSARTQLANYKLMLKQILEIIKTSDFDVAIPEIDEEKILVALPAIDDVYTQAVASRPEMKNCQLSLEQAELQERIAKAGRYPTIGLSAGISTSHNSASDNSVGTQIKQNVNNSIGLNVSVPILDQRSTKTSVAKAKIQYQQSEIDQLSQEKEIYKSVETYWLNATSAQMQYRAALANAESMRASYDLVKEQFNLGLKNIVELTTGKTNLLSAEQALLQSKYTALLNIALLKFYAGEEINL